MPTPNTTDACSTLHILAGTLGTNTEGQPLYPAHVLNEKPLDGRCKHCHTVIDPWQAEVFDADPDLAGQPSGHQHGRSRPMRVR